MLNDDDDMEGECEKLFFSVEKLVRCRARGWNIEIHTLPAFAMNLSWKWRNYLSPHRASSKYEISSVAPPQTTYSCGGAWASDKYLEQFRMSFNVGNLFSRWKSSNDGDKKERRISFDIIQLKITMKIQGEKERKYNEIICCVGKYFTIIFLSYNFLPPMYNFSCASQENEAFKFSTFKRVVHVDVSWCGKSSVSGVDAQIISSCHFHRFIIIFLLLLHSLSEERVAARH